jgi:integrase
MRRNATGSVRERVGSGGHVYRSIRFVAYNERRFVSLGPVSREEAETALRHALADVERGVWKPPVAVALPSAAEEIPAFHEYADEWWVRNQATWSDNGRADYKWRLEKHLLGFFKTYRLDEIKYATVEQYIAAKLAEKPKPLSRRSINMTLVLLAQILESAVEADLIPKNPAKGRKRRLSVQNPERSYLDTAAAITALVNAAGELDEKARVRKGQRRAFIATLVFAGLRIGEALSLRWRDVDLANGRIVVRSAKTAAGVREVNLLPVLRDELGSYRARAIADPNVLVFGTPANKQHHRSTMRQRVFEKSVEGASATLVKADLPPLPEGLTPTRSDARSHPCSLRSGSRRRT